MVSSRIDAVIMICLTASLVQGCATIHAPLTADANYPKDWPEISSAGPDCTRLNGSYESTGVRVDEKGNREKVSLAGALLDLGIRYAPARSWSESVAAHAVSLKVRPEVLRVHGTVSDYLTIFALTDSGRQRMRPFTFCGCTEQTLVCAQSYGWDGGGAAMMSTATDGSLIAIVDVTGLTRANWWLRFKRLRDSAE